MCASKLTCMEARWRPNRPAADAFEPVRVRPSGLHIGSYRTLRVRLRTGDPLQTLGRFGENELFGTAVTAPIAIPPQRGAALHHRTVDVGSVPAPTKRGNPLIGSTVATTGQ